MYEVLRKNLQAQRTLYFFVEECLDLHLGVADKSDLVRHLSQNDHSCWRDLWRDTIHYLEGMGYHSVKFEELMKQDKAQEKRWADISIHLKS